MVLLAALPAEDGEEAGVVVGPGAEVVLDQDGAEGLLEVGLVEEVSVVGDQDPGGGEGAARCIGRGLDEAGLHSGGEG